MAEPDLPRLPAQTCPACGGRTVRVRRRGAERRVDGYQRYRCKTLPCGWTGLLARAEPPATTDLPESTSRRSGSTSRASGRAALALAVLAGVALVGAAAGRAWQPIAAETVAVGSHVVHRGAHLDGDRLAPDHPLHAVLPPATIEVEPAGYLETEEARLRVRRHCAWGLPGRNPYRGSVEQALQTSQLSPTVVRQIAADIRAGRTTDRVTIGNQSIRAERSGREFNPQRVAMTYGMTLCVDTRVNFKPGHTETADLYEAMDDDGRIYAVMVPKVCGNVSVLGQRYVQSALPPAAAASAATEDPRPWMRLPPELRLRELPAALRYADADTDAATDAGAAGHRSVPVPGTLALAGLALAAAWAATTRGRR